MPNSSLKKTAWARGVLILSVMGLWTILPWRRAAASNPPVIITHQVVPIDVIFGEGKAVITRGPHNASALKKFGQKLHESPYIHLEIEGNPDSGKSKSYNESLSARRAEAVKSVLAELYNIPPGRIQTHPAGETHTSTSAVTTGPQSRPVLVIVYRITLPH